MASSLTTSGIISSDTLCSSLVSISCLPFERNVCGNVAFYTTFSIGQRPQKQLERVCVCGGGGGGTDQQGYLFIYKCPFWSVPPPPLFELQIIYE